MLYSSLLTQSLKKVLDKRVVLNLRLNIIMLYKEEKSCDFIKELFMDRKNMQNWWKGAGFRTYKGKEFEIFPEKCETLEF